jgi:pimeloyl-ACP methyl ester carboxylesterase
LPGGIVQIIVNELSFHVVHEGEGPAVLLLHGFPDSSALWRHQIPALTTAGYQVIAPDQRGFGASDRPANVAAYRMKVLVSDVLGIIDALGVQRVSVVGHDWGAAVGWAMATFAPARIQRLAALSVGHPAAYFTDIMTQREKSWYMLFFQFAGIAEDALRRDDWALFRALLREQGDIDRYLTDLDRPGALTAALNWYRANVPADVFGRHARSSLPPVQCPVLGVWSDGDHHCGEIQMQASEHHVAGPWQYVRIEGASHWIPLGVPDTLTTLLLDFLSPARHTRSLDADCGYGGPENSSLHPECGEEGVGGRGQ